MKGRKPKPTALKKAEGNPGKRRPNPAEPRPVVAGHPDRPPHLEGEAAAEWDRVVALCPPEWVARTDRATLAAYCQSWGQHVEATLALARHGLVVKSPSGYPILNPYQSVARGAMADCVKFAAELGLTPSSRSRVRADPAPAGPGDEFDL